MERARASREHVNQREALDKNTYIRWLDYFALAVKKYVAIFIFVRALDGL